MAKRRNPLQIEVYQPPGERLWRWRMYRSGHVVAMGPDGDEVGYVKRAQCRRTLLRLIATLAAQSFTWMGTSGKDQRSHL